MTFQYTPLTNFKYILKKEHPSLPNDKYTKLIFLFESFAYTYKLITKDDLLDTLNINSTIKPLDTNILNTYILMKIISTFEPINLPSTKYILYRLCSLIGVECLPTKVSDINILVVNTVFMKMNIERVY